ncbi:MAG: helix-turn-helix domain-containing protein [Planctomycetota bacterium]
MFERIVTLCDAGDGLSHCSWAVAVVIARHANDDTGEAWPSVSSIARQTRLSERTVRKALRELEALGMIELVRRSKGRKPHRVRLRLDRVPAANPEAIAALDAAEVAQPGTSCSVEPGNGCRVPNSTRQRSPLNPANGSTQPGNGCSATHHEPAREPTTSDGGGGALADGLDRATELLRALGVTNAATQAERAGSLRTVEWLVGECATARDQAAAVVARINRGERPPASWRSKAELDRARRDAEVAGERRAAQARAEKAKRQAETAAELELIERHPEIADRAVDDLLAEPGCPPLTRDLVRFGTAERRRAPRVRGCVLEAIERATGERPELATTNGRHSA